MQPIRRAVIDVGTNSVKLLVADVSGHDIRPVREQSKQTRLGHGFYETHRLQPEAIDATAKAVAAFAALAREAQALSIRVIATSAAREAVNRQELTTAIEHASGLKVEVISGDQEADLGYQGVTTNPQLAQAPLLLMDVGGGSTQFVFGRDERAHFRHSFPLGAVRLMETLPCSDPPQPAELAACRQWLKAFLQNDVQPKLLPAIGAAGPNVGVDDKPLTGELPKSSAHSEVGRVSPSAPSAAAQMGTLRTTSAQCGALGETRPTSGQLEQYALTPAAEESGAGVQLIGVGGTASILGCMEAELTSFDRARIEATRLRADRVSWHLERLWSLPLDQRMNIVGLPKNRADIILMGVAVYQAVMETFGFPELRISTRGLRFAALLQDAPQPHTESPAQALRSS
jgi:exopolyphosphatase/pppGpp-phosphohydrolase